MLNTEKIFILKFNDALKELSRKRITRINARVSFIIIISSLKLFDIIYEIFVEALFKLLVFSINFI